MQRQKSARNPSNSRSWRDRHPSKGKDGMSLRGYGAPPLLGALRLAVPSGKRAATRVNFFERNMTEPVHWLAAIGLLGALASGALMYWANKKLQDAIDETNRARRHLDALREALALMEYGAHREAFEVLSDALKERRG